MQINIIGAPAKLSALVELYQLEKMFHISPNQEFSGHDLADHRFADGNSGRRLIGPVRRMAGPRLQIG